jgi:hypothetical protein
MFYFPSKRTVLKWLSKHDIDVVTICILCLSFDALYEFMTRLQIVLKDYSIEWCMEMEAGKTNFIERSMMNGLK